MSLTSHDGMSDRELEQALDPNFGAGSPATAPLEDITDGWLRRQPVIAFGLLLALPAAGAVIEALAAGATVRAALVAAGSAIVAAGLAAVRRAVTPTADPKLDRETKLVVQ